MVRSAPAVVARGGGTKWGLADPPDGALVLETRGLAGVVEYDPAELTITALAGTPLSRVEAVLREHGQFLPFDPPFADRGATVGGAVAAGISGPSRLRFGGVRDFILAVRFIDGTGQLVRGGARVVKNAAGFDLPKLMCASRGRLGILVEATFKVFPRPQAYATLRIPAGRLDQARSALERLLQSPFEPHAVDLAPPAEDRGSWVLLVRLAGSEKAIAALVDRVWKLLDRQGELLAGEAEQRLWEELRDLRWAPEQAPVMRVLMLPSLLEPVDALLRRAGARRHYSVGGNVGWAVFDGPPAWEELAGELGRLGASAVVLRGAPPGRVWLTGAGGGAFARRVKQALDPEGRFGPL